MRIFCLLSLLLVWVGPAKSQQISGSKTSDVQSPEPRIGISAGLGVSYVSATDLVDRLNASGIVTERVSSFTAAAEFFGVLSYPVSRDWVLKVEYAYLLASYNVPTLFPGSEFSFSLHMPTLVGQYVLIDKGIYNVKGGAGLGYHFGSYSERYGTVETTFTGSGPAFKLDLEANTAFGESFYMYLGVDLRFDFVGSLESGQPQYGPGVAPTLDFFSAGAKLGFTFYL